MVRSSSPIANTEKYPTTHGWKLTPKSSGWTPSYAFVSPSKTPEENPYAEAAAALGAMLWGTQAVLSRATSAP